MMSERDFLVELCNRLLEAQELWLTAQCELIRAKAEESCARATLASLQSQIETAKFRDSLLEAA